MTCKSAAERAHSSSDHLAAATSTQQPSEGGSLTTVTSFVHQPFHWSEAARQRLPSDSLACSLVLHRVWPLCLSVIPIEHCQACLALLNFARTLRPSLPGTGELGCSPDRPLT